MSILIIYRYPANVKRKNTRLECFFPGVIIESALIFVYLLAFIRKYNIRGCRYCMDCGHGVDIPGVSAIYNDYKRSENKDIAMRHYFSFMSEEEQGGNCKKCLECTEKCPQHINIPLELEKIHKEMLALKTP